MNPDPLCPVPLYIKQHSEAIWLGMVVRLQYQHLSPYDAKH